MTNIQELPPERLCSSTHYAALIGAVLATDGPILELGCGLYSTPLLHALCQAGQRTLVSADNDVDWAEKFWATADGWHTVAYVPDWDEWDVIVSREWSVVLVDHAPAHRRVAEIKRLANRARFIVVHDTEPEMEEMYHYEAVLGEFAYRLNFTCCRPYTAIVSNLGAIWPFLTL